MAFDKNTARMDAYSPLNLAGGIRAAASRNPAKIAIRDSDKSRDYAELVDRIDRITQAFMADLGLGLHDHAAILAGNSIEYLEIVAGASQAGVAVATVNPRLTTSEVVAICDDAEARVLMVDAENADRMRDSRFASVSRIIEIGPELETWLADASPIKTPPCVPEETPFTIPYTSGTTGRPKGVLVSHRSRILNFYGMAAEYGCYSPDDRFLAIAPLCHGAGLAFAAAAIYFGGHTQLMNGFDPEAVLRSLTNDKLTGVFMVPTHFHGIFDLPETVLAQHRGAGLRAIISNAAPLPQPTKERIISHFGDGLLHETYGSTEAAIVTNLRPVDQLRKQSCVGLPFNSTLVSIRNESGEECPPGEAGELFSRSPFLFNGYWNNPEETANALQAGWVTAGDVPCRDDEGYIFIVDRKKDMVISGGINIYPREVENVLSQVPAIVEAGVIGVPDERWGERLKAFVVLEPGTEFDQQEATAFCESQLAKFKVPREFEVIDRLPRNISGKLVKADLRKRGAP